MLVGQQSIDSRNIMQVDINAYRVKLIKVFWERLKSASRW